MASNSSRSISTAPGGNETPSRRYLSALQSNSTNSIARLQGAATAFSTLTACGVTSAPMPSPGQRRSEEHTSELQSRLHLVCRLLLEKKKNNVHLLTPYCSQLWITT